MYSGGCGARHLSIAGPGRVRASWWARAHPMNASASASASASAAVAVALALAGRSPRFARGPWGAAGGGRIARRVGRRDAAKVFDRPGMACPKTPTDSRESFAHGCAKGADEGGLSLAYLSLATQRKVGRAARRADRKLLLFASSDQATKRNRGERGAHGGPGPTLSTSGQRRAARRARAHPMALTPSAPTSPGSRSSAACHASAAPPGTPCRRSTSPPSPPAHRSAGTGRSARPAVGCSS